MIDAHRALLGSPEVTARTNLVPAQVTYLCGAASLRPDPGDIALPAGDEAADG
jgi:hypothetical protein